MGFYSRRIFPIVLDHVMGRASLAAQRPLVLSQLHGSVLEIGFGAGHNLPYYPDAVERLTVIEPNDATYRRARRRIAASGRRVERIGLIGDQDVGAPADTFDFVVSTWTLCTIPDPARALREVHRVLKSMGRFVFIEHGLAPDPAVARWQHRLNPINRFLGDGCNLDRDIAAILRASPLLPGACDEFYLPDVPRIGAYTYRGSAAKHE
jgi:SAM-dependent methyltransferase